jgi:hypothetical protein
VHLRSDAAAAGELAEDAEMNRIDSELRSIAPQQCRRLECTTSSSQAVDDILKVLGYKVTGRDPIDCHALAFLGRNTPAGPIAYLPQARQFEAACSLVRHMVHKSSLLKQYIEQHKGKYHVIIPSFHATDYPAHPRTSPSSHITGGTPHVFDQPDPPHANRQSRPQCNIQAR